jgi:hypothetical protein
MSNTKPFAYNNTGTLIPGTIQVGNIAIAVSDVNFIESGLDWYMGADESIGYVICGEHPIQKIQFWRSKNMSDSSLLDLLNRNFHQNFSNSNDARIWLTNNGFYNTYPNVVTDGLILNLDASNGDSFKGEPTVNIVTNPELINLTSWEFSQYPYGTYGPDDNGIWSGNRMEIIQTEDGLRYLYLMRHSGTEMWRTLLFW